MIRAVIVIPTYNEKENVSRLVEKIDSASASLPGIEMHLLFVDDNSPDDTAVEVANVAKSHQNVHLLKRASKQGIGTAYIDGFRYAIDNFRPSIFAQIDADLQHPPEMLVSLLKTVDEGSNVAVASRYVAGGGVEGWGLSRRLVSKGANWLARTILRLHVRDVTAGFKAFDRRATDLLLLRRVSSSGFTYQVESILLFERNGMKIKEVPFIFKRRIFGESKLSGKEILEFMVNVVKLRFRDLLRVG